MLASGAAFAASSPSTPSELSVAETLVEAVRASDGSHEDLHAVAQLLAQNALLSPEQAARVAAAGPVASEHPELVDDLAAIRGDATLDATARGFRVAEAATHAQAKALDVPLVPVALAGHVLPSEALFALARGAEVTLTADEQAQARALDTLPTEQALALARVVDAFAAMNDAATRAITPDGSAPNWGETLSARIGLLTAVKDFNNVLPIERSLTASGYSLYNIELGSASNFYTTNYGLSLDVGGDDTYQNNGGGNWQDDCGIPTAASAFIDLGGSDVYAPAYNHNPNPVGPPWMWSDSCGKVGGAKDGVGFLLDAGGTNQYGSGQSEGVNGGADGPGSLGSLFSLGGNGDQFYAGGSGTNGGATSGGVGLLVSTGSASSHLSGGWEGSNGGAANGGMGMMIDLGTNGGYYASIDGTNGGATGLGSSGFAYGSGDWSAGSAGTNGGGYQGGHGSLVSPSGGSFNGGCDGSNGGADGLGSTGALYAMGAWNYQGCDHGSNGGGSNGGHGTLVDPLSSGTFSGGSYGSNGGAYGIGSSGFLYSGLGGWFTAGDHGTNGGGSQTAVGMLLASGGSLSAGSNGVNGGASEGGIGSAVLVTLWSAAASNNGVNGGGFANGRGLLLSALGDTVYSAGGFGTNGGGFSSGEGMLADLSGNDAYVAGTAGNGCVVGSGSTGLLLDVQGVDTYNGVAFNGVAPCGIGGVRFDILAL